MKRLFATTALALSLGSAVAAAECSKVTFSDVGWTDITATTAATTVVLDALGYEVRLITLDHAYYLRNIERVPYYANGTDELGDTAAEASRDCNAIILEYHGCSTLGDTIDMAYRRALNLEEAAQNTFRCLQLGNTDLTFPKEEWARIHHA